MTHLCNSGHWHCCLMSTIQLEHTAPPFIKQKTIFLGHFFMAIGVLKRKPDDQVFYSELVTF